MKTHFKAKDNNYDQSWGTPLGAALPDKYMTSYLEATSVLSNAYIGTVNN